MSSLKRNYDDNMTGYKKDSKIMKKTKIVTDFPLDVFFIIFQYIDSDTWHECLMCKNHKLHEILIHPNVIGSIHWIFNACVLEDNMGIKDNVNWNHILSNIQILTIKYDFTNTGWNGLVHDEWNDLMSELLYEKLKSIKTLKLYQSYFDAGVYGCLPGSIEHFEMISTEVSNLHLAKNIKKIVMDLNTFSKYLDDRMSMRSKKTKFHSSEFIGNSKDLIIVVHDVHLMECDIDNRHIRQSMDVWALKMNVWNYFLECVQNWLSSSNVQEIHLDSQFFIFDLEATWEHCHGRCDDSSLRHFSHGKPSFRLKDILSKYPEKLFVIKKCKYVKYYNELENRAKDIEETKKILEDQMKLIK